MRNTALFLATSLTTAVATTDHGYTEDTMLPRQAASLSPCVLQCLTQNPITDACGDTPPALENCILSNCSIEDALQAQKLQAETCHFPDRTMVPTSAQTLWTLFTFCLLFLAMRGIGRLRAVGGAGYGIDDLVLFASCLPMIGFTVTAWLGLESGLGRDTWELSLQQIEYCLKLIYVGQTLYIAVVYGSKISFVLLYMRIWKEPVMFHRLCQGVLVLLVASFVTFEFTAIFQCAPVSYNWTFVAGIPGSCVDRLAIADTNTGWNIALDVVVLLLPVHSILKLQMHWPRKAMLLAVFSVGAAVTICSIVRLQYIVHLTSSTNPIWDYTFIGLWSLIEVDLSIICCCVPMVAGLMHRLWNQGRWVLSKRRVEEASGSSSGGSPTSSCEDEKRVTKLDALVGRKGIDPTDDLESGKLSDESRTTDSSPTGRSDSSGTQVEVETPQSSDDECTVTSEAVYGLAEEKLKRTHDSFIGQTRTSTDAYSIRSWDRPMSQEPKEQQAEVAVMFSPRHIRRPTDDSERPPSRGRSTRERSLPGSRGVSEHGGVVLPTRPEPAMLQDSYFPPAPPIPDDSHTVQSPDSSVSRSTQHRAAIAEAMPPLTIGAPPPHTPTPLDIGEPLAQPPADWPPTSSPPLSTSSNEEPPSPSWFQKERTCQQKAGQTAQSLATTAFELGTELTGTELAEGMELTPKFEEQNAPPSWDEKERKCQQKAGQTAQYLATTAFAIGTEIADEDPHAQGTQLTTPADWAPVKPTPTTEHENPLRSQGRSSLFGSPPNNPLPQPPLPVQQIPIAPAPLPATSSKRSSPTISDGLIAPAIVRKRSSSENSMIRQKRSSADLTRQRSSADMQRSVVRKGSSPTILDDLVLRAQARKAREREGRQKRENSAWEWREIPDWRNIDTL